MTSKNVFRAVAVAAVALAAQSAWAQASAPVTREQRKAETAAANKAGKLTPAGEGPSAPPPPTTSTMTKAERKAQAKADQKAGKMTPAGEGPGGPAK